MATKPVDTPAPSKTEKTYNGLTRKQLIEFYRLMFMSRRLDDRGGSGPRAVISRTNTGTMRS